MANTYIKIASNVLSTDTATVTFSAIPATYTDLVLKISARSSRADGAQGQNMFMSFNGNSSSIYSVTVLRGNGASASSARSTDSTLLGQTYIAMTGVTANIFNNNEYYFPNYASSANKVLSAFAAVENDAANIEYMSVTANLFRSTAAISSIALTLPSGNYITGSSFYLYGIKSS
jgi:hypothetical protein